MKTICVMRHADAPNLATTDFERVLSPLGKEQSVKAANHLKDFDFNLIITSDAPRVLETSKPIEAFHPNARISRDTSIYSAATDEYLTLITNVSNKHKKVLFIGHNPTIFNTVLAMAIKPQPHFNMLALKGMTNAKVVTFTIDTDEKLDSVEDRCVIQNIFDSENDLKTTKP